MKVNEFLEKYCLHDSTIDEIRYNSHEKELIWHMDFAFWMQKDYVEGNPENGMINLHFYNVENYSGLIGKIDWFSVDSITLHPNGIITCVVLDDYNDDCYIWNFYVSNIEIEDLHIDTTNA